MDDLGEDGETDGARSVDHGWGWESGHGREGSFKIEQDFPVALI